MHLGLIGGIGPAATVFYYRRLAQAHNAAQHPMELTLVHAQVSELLQNMTGNAPDRQAQTYVRLTQRLQAAGAEVVAITSMAGHFCIREFEPLSPLPIINAIPELAAELTRRGLRRIGLIGSRVVMASQVYGALSDLEVVVPSGESFNATHDAYIAMATAGQVTEQQRSLFFAVGNELCRTQGAEAVVLVGTDLFLAFEGYDCGFPVIDSAEVHVNALVRTSLDGLARTD
ncbi:MAG TPA: aspartate/glutamate racemase family protein [Blastocatellia bacterium]|nr:aspartate/glutamate racemase family protein [Blastocatellia bacterium]HMX25907.1 aspartate/glutamate racemase family protein [Blastocatellia bacterium]HMY72937.1 aspartate/glutamate racemase family protein [Blastocatellia bacterium]